MHNGRSVGSDEYRNHTRQYLDLLAEEGRGLSRIVVLSPDRKNMLPNLPPRRLTGRGSVYLIEVLEAIFS